VPELPEVERYRTLLADHGLDRRIVAVDADDAWYLKRGLDEASVRGALTGRRLVRADRRGKLLVAATDGGPAVGLHFGMSGRLLIDGRSAIERLLYAPAHAEVRWDRFTLHFGDGGDLRMHDPRRLGGVELDPNLSRLGPDALGAALTDVTGALAGAKVALKARLLDQARLAGIGNLVADELLWRAGFSPLRPAGSLDQSELRRLHRGIGATLRLLIRRGGSHTGDVMAARRPGASCPRDGAPMRRSTVGGRTTWWCSAHQD
jgi:formamidopyrimidine-DNA glycosylase